MKHIHKTLAAAALSLLCAACLLSCNSKDDPTAPNKSNPTEFTLKGCDFGITLLDYEKGGATDSSYVFEGVWKEGAFRFGWKKLDEMTPNILPDGRNRLVFNVDSEDAGFEGVNAASTSRCINIVPVGKDHTSYELEWVAEGESTITLWCGEGNSRKEVSFKVTSKKEIPFTGIKVRFHDGNNSSVQIAKCINKDAVAASANCKMFDGDWSHCSLMEIVGPEPLNATMYNERNEKIIMFVTTLIKLPLVDEKYKISSSDDMYIGWNEYFEKCPDLNVLDPIFNSLSFPKVDIYETHSAYGYGEVSASYDKNKLVNFSDIRERRIRGYKAQYSYRPGARGGFSMSFDIVQEKDYEKKVNQEFIREDWYYYSEGVMN